MNSAFYTYYQKLLLAQYDASEEFTHAPTRGSLREKFLKNIVGSHIRKIELLHGQVSDGEKKSSECDCLIVRKDTSRVDIANDSVDVDIKDCLCVIDVKSHLTGSMIKKLNLDAVKLKSLKSGTNVKYGVFTYHLGTSKKALLKKFGIEYDKDTDSYSTMNSASKLKIDFVISISQPAVDGDDDNQFFISRDVTGQYFLKPDIPAIQHLFGYLENLI